MISGCRACGWGLKLTELWAIDTALNTHFPVRTRSSLCFGSLWFTEHLLVDSTLGFRAPYFSSITNRLYCAVSVCRPFLVSPQTRHLLPCWQQLRGNFPTAFVRWHRFARPSFRTIRPRTPGAVARGCGRCGIWERVARVSGPSRSEATKVWDWTYVPHETRFMSLCFGTP